MMDSIDSIVLSRSVKGALCLHLNGYEYRKEGHTPKEHTYWRCKDRGKYKCKGSIKVHDNVPLIVNEHCHPVNCDESIDFDKENIIDDASVRETNLKQKSLSMDSSPSLRRYSPWGEKELLDAVMAIEMGKLDTQAAAQTYRIPISTIRKEIRRISATLSPLKKSTDESSPRKKKDVEISPIAPTIYEPTKYPDECYFCGQDENNKEKFGDLMHHESGLTLHVHCMLFASGLAQNGDPKNGLMGFTIEDIESENKRGKRLKCSYCGFIGATIGCVLRKCKKVFHFSCGSDHNALNQFYGNFSSFCCEHRPLQNLPDKNDSNTDFICCICMNAVEDPFGSYDALFSPCCASNFYHRGCIQRMALNAGCHFLKCPLCNNKDDFQNEMLRHGINIPDRDATWESEPNAFMELHERHSNCDVPRCYSRKGRKYNLLDSPLWEIVLCDICGSHGCHLKCGNLKKPSDNWECRDCKDSLEGYTGQVGVKKKKKVKKKVINIDFSQKIPGTSKPSVEAVYKKRKRVSSSSEHEENLNSSIYTPSPEYVSQSKKISLDMQKSIEQRSCSVSIIPLDKVKDHYISRLYTSTLCKIELSKRRKKKEDATKAKAQILATNKCSKPLFEQNSVSSCEIIDANNVSDVELVCIVDSTPNEDCVSSDEVAVSASDPLKLDTNCNYDSKYVEELLESDNHIFDHLLSGSLFDSSMNVTFDETDNSNNKSKASLKSTPQSDKENNSPIMNLTNFFVKVQPHTSSIFDTDSTINKNITDGAPKKYDRHTKLKLCRDSSLKKSLKLRKNQDMNKTKISPPVPEGQKLISQFFKSHLSPPIFDVEDESESSGNELFIQHASKPSGDVKESSCLKDISSERNKMKSDPSFNNVKDRNSNYSSCSHEVVSADYRNNISSICFCSSTVWHQI